MTTAKTVGIDALLHRHFTELVDATFANLFPDAVAELVALIGEDEYNAWFDETFPEDAETLATWKEKYLAVEAKISEVYELRELAKRYDRHWSDDPLKWGMEERA